MKIGREGRVAVGLENPQVAIPNHLGESQPPYRDPEIRTKAAKERGAWFGVQADRTHAALPQKK